MAKKYKKVVKAKKNPMAMSNNVENEILSRYQVGSVASNHAARELYLIDTGILDLNLALGTNGVLGGRMSRVWGDKGNAKTMLLLCMCAQVQRDGGNAAFLDPEGTFDAAFARMLGVDTDNLFLVSAQEQRIDPKTHQRLNPLSGEEFYDIANLLIYSGKYHLVCMDSITACIPNAMLEKKTTDQSALKGAQANMNSLMLQKTNAFLTMAPHCHFAMISQSRDVPMVMSGPTKKPSGGNAPGFYVTYEILAKKKNTHRAKLPIIEGVDLKVEQDVAIDLELQITKNKVARIYEPAIVYVDLRTGVCQATDVFQTARKLGVIEQKSSHYYYGEWNWNGGDNVITALKENEGLYAHMRQACIDTMGIRYTDLSTESGGDIANYGSEEFNEQMEQFKEEVEPDVITNNEEEDGEEEQYSE